MIKEKVFWFFSSNPARWVQNLPRKSNSHLGDHIVNEDSVFLMILFFYIFFSFPGGGGWPLNGGSTLLQVGGGEGRNLHSIALTSAYCQVPHLHNFFFFFYSGITENYDLSLSAARMAQKHIWPSLASFKEKKLTERLNKKKCINIFPHLSQRLLRGKSLIWKELQVSLTHCCWVWRDSLIEPVFQ